MSKLEELKESIKLGEIVECIPDLTIKQRKAIATLLSHAKLSLVVGKVLPKERKLHKEVELGRFHFTGCCEQCLDSYYYNKALADCNAVLTNLLAEIPEIVQKVAFDDFPVPLGLTMKLELCNRIATAIQKEWEER